MGDKAAELHKFRPGSELGSAEDYPVGSIEWAERISNRLQIGARSVNQHTVYHLWDTIKAIWMVKPHPWEIWPEGRPFKTPDDYSRAVTGHPWGFLVDVVAEFSEDPDLKGADIVKTPTPFEQVEMLLEKLSDSDRRRVLRLLEQQLKQTDH
jgi:hypothetical protein